MLENDIDYEKFYEDIIRPGCGSLDGLTNGADSMTRRRFAENIQEKHSTDNWYLDQYLIYLRTRYNFNLEKLPESKQRMLEYIIQREKENKTNTQINELQKILNEQKEIIDALTLILNEKNNQIQYMQKTIEVLKPVINKINKEKLENLKKRQKKAIGLAVTHLKNTLGTEYTLQKTNSENVLIQLCFDIIKSNQKLFISYEEVSNYYQSYKYVTVSSNSERLFCISYDDHWEFLVFGVKYTQDKEPVADKRGSIVFYPKKDRNFKKTDLIKLFSLTKQRFCINKEISEFLPQKYFDFPVNKCDTDKCEQRSQCETYKKILEEQKKLQR